MRSIFMLVALVACSGGSRLDSPEAALACYMEAKRAGDQKAIQDCYHFENPEMRLSLKGPEIVDSWEIRQELVLGELEAAAWNQKESGVEVGPGDVQLQVEEFSEGKGRLFTFLLREIDGEWRIIGHKLWDMYS